MTAALAFSDTHRVLAALGVGPRASMLGSQRVYRTSDVDEWRHTACAVVDLKVGLGRVVDALHDVAVAFGETAG